MRIEHNIGALKDFLGEMASDQLPFAMSHAMNMTMKGTLQQLKVNLDDKIEGGATRFTKTGMSFVASSKRDLHSVLYFKPDRYYMEEVIHGGTKKATKATGGVLPEPIAGGTKTNKFGNFPRGKITKLRGNKQYFVGRPKGFPNAPIGVWRRYGKGGLYKNGKPRGRIKLMISLDRSVRKQKMTYDMSAHAEQIYLSRFDRQFAWSYRRAVNSRIKYLERHSSTGY